MMRYVLIILIAALACYLATAPQWSGIHFKEYAARSDARITEYMAGAGIGALTKGQREGVEKGGGAPGPLQAHRILTPWLLKQMPGPSWRERWIQVAMLSMVIIALSAGIIGYLVATQKGIALAVALAAATAGWQICRIPWHKDTPTMALLFLASAILVALCRPALNSSGKLLLSCTLALILLLGTLAKESFFFMSIGVMLGLWIDEIIRWRKQNATPHNNAFTNMPFFHWLWKQSPDSSYSRNR